MDPNKAILSCAILTVTSTTAASLLPVKNGGSGELPKPRVLIGTALTFTALGMLADAAPGLAVPLAAIVAVSALTFYGLPIADNYFNGSTNPVGFQKGK